MYPNALFFGITLYDLCLALGAVAALVLFRILSDKTHLSARKTNLALVGGLCGFGLGLFTATLLQAFYNYMAGEPFAIVANTGATFYGGLIGGVAAFLAVYFPIGLLVFGKSDDKRYHIRHFFDIASSAIPGVIVAHGFGRLGCLTAGCCHGAPTEAWYGIKMYGDLGYAKYVPVQLFEALFLFALFGLLFIRAKEGKGYHLPLYMWSYGAWRFLAEFLRADYRGSVGIDAVTPSQLIAILMIIGGVGVYFLEKAVMRRIGALEAAEKDE